ncbi:MAG TPA: NAD(P)/FAD-dependent oxidoreductase [Gemmatimonadaceae bacterium]|nr:NAD(P)/FAD-dependent oxidoreductase [Gemmatimonadaceae bacterium]
MPDTDVVIVGAGATGLGVGAALRRRGVRALLLDRDDRVGGTWAKRYERLHLHTVRRFSGLPFQPVPPTEPRYVPTHAYAAYLSTYAHTQQLDVRLGAQVRRITREDGSWMVEMDAQSGTRWHSPAVIVATGRHNVPHMPDWPGASDFGGRVLHSHAYLTGRTFAGQRALVVGIGNSGAEIATDLVECGAQDVAISVRTPPPITSREIAGIPVQLLGMFLKPFPARFVDWLGRGLRRIGTGDLSPYGLAAERWGPFVSRRPPVIDVGFLAQLKAGRIRVRPDVRRLTPTGVVFVDGSEAPFDVVIAATGYSTGLRAIVDVPGALDERGYPVGENPGDGLWFAGFVESPRGQLYESAQSAPRLAREVSAFLARRSWGVNSNGRSDRV